jgi:hypothetical protein
MPKLLLILFTLLLLCCEESQEAKLLAKKKAEEIELENARIELENARRAESELEAKLKAEYEKRFGVPISDFELSVKSATYYYAPYYSIPRILPQISITRTATGAIAKYMVYGQELELELDMVDWLDFVNALHKSNVKEKRYPPKIDGELEILFSSSEKFKFNRYHPNWSEFVNLMEVMTARVKKGIAADIEPKLKLEYEKKFGVPISDFELSISYVYYIIFPFEISTTRTAKGAHMKHQYVVQKSERDFDFINVDTYVDIGEWLDFVRVLKKCNVNEWKKEYYHTDKNQRKRTGWVLYIKFWDKDELSSISGITDSPPEWDEFMEAMHDFAEKIKVRAEAK